MGTPFILYFGSSSQSRYKLLHHARIPFTLVDQSADESKCDWNLPLSDVVKNIAAYKMQNVLLPMGTEGEVCFVLTADTLTTDQHGAIHGKPTSEQDVIDKLKEVYKGPVITGTAFCLERRKYSDGAWHTQERTIEYAEAQYVFQVSDAWFQEYLKHSVGKVAAGAIGIEEYGDQFLKSLNGSRSAVIGLPLFELREALQKMGFFV